MSWIQSFLGVWKRTIAKYNNSILTPIPFFTLSCQWLLRDHQIWKFPMTEDSTQLKILSSQAISEVLKRGTVIETIGPFYKKISMMISICIGNVSQRLQYIWLDFSNIATFSQEFDKSYRMKFVIVEWK